MAGSTFFLAFNRTGALTAVAATVLAFLAACTPPQRPETPPQKWFKGNLHTHTLWSDGDDFPDMVVDWYASANYDFLMLSDHNVFADTIRWVDVDSLLRPAFDRYVERFGAEVDSQSTDGLIRARLKTVEELQAAFNSPGDFVLIPGEEITERVERLPVHLNATNIVEFVPPQGGSTVAEVLQRNIDAVLEQRERTHQPMFPHINHPNYYWAVTVEDIVGLEGERFFEIYNGHPLVHNAGDGEHLSVESMWDLVLSRRLAAGRDLIYGLAVDDAHHYQGMDPALANPGRGWIVVQADTLSPESIVLAMEAGRFYASTGVTLRSLTFENGVLSLEIKPEDGITYTTDFVGTLSGDDSGEAGAVLASVDGPTASYELDGSKLYVRARIVSSKPKFNPNMPNETERAWTQPVRR